MFLKALKYTLVSLSILLFFVVAAVLLAWSYPEKILTSERVSQWASPYLHFEKIGNPVGEPPPLVTLEIGKQGWKRRSVSVRLAPGCYSPTLETLKKSQVCLESAEIGISFRLSKRPFVKFTGIDRLVVKISRGTFHTSSPETEKSKTETNPGKPFRFFNFLSEEFRWGVVSIDVKHFELPNSDLNLTAKVTSTEEGLRGSSRSPKLALDVKVESSEWTMDLGGEALQKETSLILPTASVSFRKHTKNGKTTLSLGGEIAATYALNTNDLDVRFSVNWRNPTPDFEAIKAESGTLRMHAGTIELRTTLKALLHGKTPLGRLPLIAIDFGATLEAAEDSESRPIELRFNINAYEFAGIKANSNLEIALLLGPEAVEIQYRKGELRLETPNLGKTIRMLSQTAWAVPVPFNVFEGPVVFHTDPFRNDEDRTTLPVVLTTDLKSNEQAFKTETRAEIDLGKNDFAVLGIRIASIIDKIQLRLPDYDPIAPIPALARDSRIIRYGEKFDKPKTSLPVAVSVKGPPGSIVLINRLFNPSLSAGLNIESHPATGEIKGSVSVSRPFDIQYLNRKIRLEKLGLTFSPAVETAALISMERAGYHIEADLKSLGGKTQILLASTPPLNDDEIISILIYGMPKNSISSEQSKSVGSTQAAMSSQALGIFSFFAFASTPIQSVLYNPETQTYSAVVNLPGGITASIGSSWENDRQLALSKSVGRNWAVSTELIKDSDGVERGGTLLRWRKSY